MIIPAGQDHFSPKTLVATGPFKVNQIFPAQRMNTVRFPNYWEHGLPYLDKLDFVYFADPGSRVNALLSGQVGAAVNVPYAQAHQITSAGLALLNAPGGSFIPLIMNASTPPFNDARVRLAMKLIANRPLMVQNALSGFGAVGNDIPGRGDPFYVGDKLAQRHQDIEQAKSLLKQAGQSNLTVDLESADGTTGMLASAEIFGQEASKAGITVNVKNNPSATYFTSSGPWKNSSFYQDWWGGFPFIEVANTVYKAYGEGEYANPKLYSLLNQAYRTVDATKRAEIERNAELLLHNDGPHIIWGFYNSLDSYSKKFAGFVGSPAYSFGDYDFRSVHAV